VVIVNHNLTASFLDDFLFFDLGINHIPPFGTVSVDEEDYGEFHMKLGSCLRLFLQSIVFGKFFRHLACSEISLKMAGPGQLLPDEDSFNFFVEFMLEETCEIICEYIRECTHKAMHISCNDSDSNMFGKKTALHASKR
jgi:hypothetical protein